MRSWWWLLAALAATLLLIGGDPIPGQHGTPNYFGLSRPQNMRNLEAIAKADPRIEKVARAICKQRGIDPDHRGPPFPEGPVWEIFIPQAAEFIAAMDALNGKAAP